MNFNKHDIFKSLYYPKRYSLKKVRYMFSAEASPTFGHGNLNHYVIHFFRNWFLIRSNKHRKICMTKCRTGFGHCIYLVCNFVQFGTVFLFPSLELFQTFLAFRLFQISCYHFFSNAPFSRFNHYAFCQCRVNKYISFHRQILVSTLCFLF